MEGFAVEDVLLWGCVWGMSGSNLGGNVVYTDRRFWFFGSVIHVAAFGVMLEVSDSVVNT
jgi:hypothetical protein